MNIKVAIFTFNTEAQIFCCSCDKKEECGSTRKILSFMSSNCILSDFAGKFVEYIQSKNNNKLPDTFIISLQESSIKNPKKGFKSDQLIHAFYNCILKYDSQYSLFKEKMEGVGAEGIRGIRIGFIVKKRQDFEIKFRFLFYNPLFESKIAISEGQQFGKGALMLDTIITNKISGKNETYGLKFINTHLPFLGKKGDQGKSIRDKTIIETMSYFTNIIKQENKSITDNIFLMGDLNYRISFNDSIEQNKFIDLLENSNRGDFGTIKSYLNFDQLRNSIKGNTILMEYKEGINDEGPSFFPTCKLVKKCIDGNNIREYQLTKGNTQRIPSWCDRILYTGDNITCLLYESFDRGQTCKSDHIPVIGLYEIKFSEQKGGDNYYKKYLKYKQKYFEFRNDT